MESVTGFPEILDGRVKTLHPVMHGGLLARARPAEHCGSSIRSTGSRRSTWWPSISIRSGETVAKPDVTFEDAIENIDIGGPSMLRSAAKNHEFVLLVVDPDDYPRVIAAAPGGHRRPRDAAAQLAAKVFTPHRRLRRRDRGLPDAPRGRPAQPVTLSMEQVKGLRYGENPQQRAALYATEEPRGIRDLRQRQGKELSFNNLLDLDGGDEAVALVAEPARLRHHQAHDPLRHRPRRNAAKRPRERPRPPTRRRRSASVIAFNTVVDRAAADAMRELFVEVVVAPPFHDDALARLR